MNNKYSLLLLLPISLLPFINSASAAEALTLRKAVQRVIDTYPSVRVSKLQVDKAGQELVRADSLLGWQVNAEAGVAHDTSPSIFPSDIVNATGGLQRQLESGGTLGIQGGYNRSDSTDPSLSSYNPLTTTRADVIYRKPLRQGSGNPVYRQSAVSARSGLEIAKAGHRSLLNQVAQQTIDLYYGLATTQARMQAAENGVKNAQQLLEYVQRNTRLGLAEKKDLLQVEAQLRAQQADLETLRTSWEQQRTNFNRLMGQPWSEEFDLVSVNSERLPSHDLDKLIKEIEAVNPDIARLEAQIDIAESSLKLAKDKHRSKLDLVLSAGARTGNGGSFDETDYAAGVKLEYQRPLSRRGLKAEVFQTQINRDITQRELAKTKQDLLYQIQGLLAELKAGQTALDATKQRFETESEKLAETRQRYRNGRADTSQLIQFENELNFAEFSVKQQTLELARKQHTLKLLRGALWHEFQLENTGLEAGRE
jgi:outer membrane protein TolC